MKTLLLAALLVRAAPAGPAVVTLDSRAPLIPIKVMFRVGSADDPAGLEGLAAMTASLVVEGGYREGKKLVTKEQLAERVRPWGERARPSATVSKETTVFSFTVPKDALDRYLAEVLAPMLLSPEFQEKELDRIRGEALQGLTSGLRLEQIEMLGLTALDNLIHAGTPYAHPTGGTEKGLKAVRARHIERFYRSNYAASDMVLGVASSDPAVAEKLRSALAGLNALAKRAARPAAPPAKPQGRSALVVTMPNAISTGLHAGYPLEVTRTHPDFWPLYVGNIWFGAHRDGFSHLYQVIREARGYNYGDYSYIEHFEGRPFRLFMPFNHPRLFQYFSIWIRPVAHPYAGHLLKALTWELESFARRGLTEEECELTKNKAKVLYLSLAETTERLLESRLDDRFYGMEPGFLTSYLSSIEKTTCAQVNAAIAKHLQAKDLAYLAVTDDDEAQKLVEAILPPEKPLWGKDPAEYQIDVSTASGAKVYSVPEGKLDLLRLDAVWAHTPLGLEKAKVRTAPSAKLFETADLP